MKVHGAKNALGPRRSILHHSCAIEQGVHGMRLLTLVNVRSGPNGFLKLGMLVSLDLVVVVDAKIAFGARPSAHGLLSCTALAQGEPLHP